MMQTRSPRKRSARGFTILEAMMAAIVMAFAITTAITTMQHGFLAIDASRNVVTAGQIMQTEIEKLRGLCWTDISALPTATTSVNLDAAYASLPNASNFTLTRTITTVQADMLRIDFDVSWTDYNGSNAAGTSVTRRYTTYYARYGLYDWFILT